MRIGARMRRLGGWRRARTGRIPRLREVTLSTLKSARTASQTALTATDREREEAQAVYAEAQPLAVDICDTVEFHYRRDPSPSSRRAKCRRWGVVYIYSDEETPAPGDTTAPPSNPEPPTPAPETSPSQMKTRQSLAYHSKRIDTRTDMITYSAKET